MGTDFAFSEATSSTMTFHDAVEYCRTTYDATLPIIQNRLDANHITVEQEIQFNSKKFPFFMLGVFKISLKTSRTSTRAKIMPSNRANTCIPLY